MRIDELITRYQLEPQLRDIFVEGAFDKDVLGHAVDATENADCVFYEIDVVDVPADLLRAQNLTDGKKQRIIALARELAHLPDGCALRFIVDRDLDYWFGALEDTPRLKWTEFTSIELYFLQCEFVRNCVSVTAKAKVANWPAFYSSLVEALREMYLLRLADREFGWGMTWIDFEKSLSLEDASVIFDRGGYVQKLLMANCRLKEKVRYVEAVDAWRIKTAGDPRACIRGHDFVDVMAHCVRKFGGLRAYAEPATLQRLFVLTSQTVPALRALVA